MVVMGDKVNDNWENGKKGYKFFGYKNGEIMPYISYIFGHTSYTLHPNWLPNIIRILIFA
jgi:hypothetical protein